jgi:magnesium-transporting ATPase (P-type)
MRLKPSSYFLIGVLVIALLMIIAAAPFKSIQTKLLPMVISGIAFILAAAELIKELRAKEKPQLPEEKIDQEKPGQSFEEPLLPIRRYGGIMVWVIITSLAIYLIGFLIALPVFILSYLKTHGYGWLKSIIIAAGMTAILFVVFEVLLRMDLYDGLFFILWR